MMDPFAKARVSEYPHADHGIHVNAASWGLLPERARKAITTLQIQHGTPAGLPDAEWGGVFRRARAAAASLIGVDSGEISLSPNTSFGVNLGAACVAAGPPGRIVVSEGEFPANVLPWLPLEQAGFRVEVVPADAAGLPQPDRLLEALDQPDARALAMSLVQFHTGYTADAALFGRACREREILFVVDAIQGLGVVPLDARAAQIDVLACGAQKWLCSPWGSGFSYVAAELRDRFAPPMTGWLSVKQAEGFAHLLDYRLDWVESGRKFEMATLGMQDYLGMACAIELLLELGPAEIRGHIHGLHDVVFRWAEGRGDVRMVTPHHTDERAGILAFNTPRDEAAFRALSESRVVCSFREGMLRLSPHFYNTVDEMERIVDIMDGVL